MALVVRRQMAEENSVGRCARVTLLDGRVDLVGAYDRISRPLPMRMFLLLAMHGESCIPITAARTQNQCDWIQRSNEAAQYIRFHIHYATLLLTLQYLLVTDLLFLHHTP